MRLHLQFNSNPMHSVTHGMRGGAAEIRIFCQPHAALRHPHFAVDHRQPVFWASLRVRGPSTFVKAPRDGSLDCAMDRVSTAGTLVPSLFGRTWEKGVPRCPRGPHGPATAVQNRTWRSGCAYSWPTSQHGSQLPTLPSIGSLFRQPPRLTTETANGIRHELALCLRCFSSTGQVTRQSCSAKANLSGHPSPELGSARSS